MLKQQGYYDESEKLITFNNNDKWFKQNKLTANDLSTKELIRTALLNVDKSKASLGEVNTCKNTYSLKEINDSLGEIINRIFKDNKNKKRFEKYRCRINRYSY